MKSNVQRTLPLRTHRAAYRTLAGWTLGTLVLTNREHVIALEARDKGLMGMLLRYPYEVRDARDNAETS